MPSNVEIKARVGDAAKLFARAQVIADHGETTAQGVAIARDIMERLGVDAGDLVDRAYVDLLPSVA